MFKILAWMLQVKLDLFKTEKNDLDLPEIRLKMTE